MKWFLALILLVMPCAFWGQQLSQRITNQDVIDMVALGLSDDLIIQKLRTVESPQFDTSVQGLAEAEIRRKFHVAEIERMKLLRSQGTSIHNLAVEFGTTQWMAARLIEEGARNGASGLPRLIHSE